MKTQTWCCRARCGCAFIPVLLSLTLGAACDSGQGGSGGTEGDNGSADDGTAGDNGAVDDGSSGSDSAADSSGGDGSGGDSSGGDASDGGSSSGGDSSGSGGEGIEIAGVWIESYDGGMTTHTISDTEWLQSSDFGDYDYALDSFDNATRTAIASDTDGFAKFQWTWTDSGTQLWYCTAAFGAATAAEAAAAPDADPSDPANGGCSTFAWSALDPAS